MKYIISENRLNNYIYEYINNYYNEKDIHWVYGTDDEYNYYSQNIDMRIYVEGEWRNYDNDVVFYYYNKDYYGDEPSEKPFKDKAPILVIEGDEYYTFNGLFGNLWKESMKQWFEKNFNLPVNTITND